MIIIRQGSRKPILIHGGRSTVIDEKSAKAMQGVGIPASGVTEVVYDRLKSMDARGAAED